MNVAAQAALSAAVAAHLAQQRELAKRLHDEGATAPERAQPLPESDAELLESLVEEGVVVESAPGPFHVDPVKYAEWTAPRPGRESAKKTLAVLLIVAAAAVSAGLLTSLAFAGLLGLLTGAW